MIFKGFLPIILTICEMMYFTGGQHVPPGVPPQHYQQQPMGQQVPHMQQQQQHIPIQQQQQQMHMQQPQMHLQQQQQQMHMQQPPMQQVPVQQQMHQQPHQQAHHHGHAGQPPQVLNVANIAQEKDHIAEHMAVPIDTSKMTEQELQFHYFKMHDADNNNKLDGCELIKSLIHWHVIPNNQTKKRLGAEIICYSDEIESPSGEEEKEKEPTIHSDNDIESIIDSVLKTADQDNDGFISYTEFKVLES